ncbi:hypothetical protein LSAT2_014055, partial [Lamellibrachia satsuma]
MTVDVSRHDGRRQPACRSTSAGMTVDVSRHDGRRQPA